MSVILEIKAKPGARATILEVKDGIIHARIAAQPVDGEANKELLRALSKVLGLPRASISLQSGSTARTKLVRVGGTVGKEELLRSVNTYKW